MSGDVQPRKRKDKKRKKDESSEQIPFPPPTFTSGSNLNDDLNIHVHSEGGTGGGICAKIIFFILFSALAVLVCLIITEHRGLTDLDTVEQESRFSQLFEGWTDTGLAHDDEHDHIEDSLLDDHDHDEDEHKSDEHEEHESEEEEEHEQSEEEEEENIVSEEASPEEDEVDDEQPISEEEEEEEEEEENEESEVNEGEVSEEENVNEDDNSVEDEQENEDEEDVDDDNDEVENFEDSKEAESTEEQTVADQSEENEQNEDNEQQSNEQEDEIETKQSNDEEIEEERVVEHIEEDTNYKMVVKIGVGVALLVVAHVVLVRKWKTANTTESRHQKEEILPDLSRRNTIVAPPSLQEIEPDLEENIEKQYLDEDNEVESDNDKTTLTPTKLKYQELKTTYSRSLTPESETEYQTKSNQGEDEEEEEDDDDYEDEEEEEEVEDDEDEDNDIEEVAADDEEEASEKDDEDDDDDDLLKRLEAKYGKLGKADNDNQFSSWKRVNVRHDNEPEESDSDKQSDIDSYEYENITNKDDFKIKEKIDEAQKNIRNNTAYAVKLFDILLQHHPSSPRSLYGKAQALDLLAEQRRSNDILKNAIEVYLEILNLQNVPNALFELAADRCVNRLRFLGQYNRAIDVHHKLMTRFPEENKYRNQLVVSYLTMNRLNKARSVLQETLAKDSEDGFALVHYGFILKTADNNLKEAVRYLKKGIATKHDGVIDGRFYFHLGDALARLGQPEEAMKVYEEGVQHNLFLSKYQRSLYNVGRLKGQPWWSKNETPYKTLFEILENNWKQIRNEGLSILNSNGLFQPESENLKDSGEWKQFELFARGQKNVKNCKKCPLTCKIIESVPDAKGCTRGQTKFSVMHPGTHVWPHCGPTNCRLRIHLGLKVPPNTYIRVANDTRSWENGNVLIFDDSFEHEVWHNGTTTRLVLIVDVWHPELTLAEKRSLLPI